MSAVTWVYIACIYAVFAVILWDGIRSFFDSLKEVLTWPLRLIERRRR